MSRIVHYGFFQLLWLRFLYRVTLLLAAGLGATILISPLLTLDPSRDAWHLIGYLFAQDAILRKTAAVSALGLWVTAVVFFRPRMPSYWRRRGSRYGIAFNDTWDRR